MKMLVIGLDGAVPELLLGDDRLTNIRRLMVNGCFGRLESIIPPITVPAWMCMATSQDPGSLGVYGFRNRTDHSYDGLGIVNSKSIQELALWDQVAREGKRSILLGVPPSYPPRRINGICVGCFLTPDTSASEYTHPRNIADEIARLVGEYQVDVKGFRTNRKDWLKEQVLSMTRKRFTLARHLLQNHDWDYFHMVEIGLDRLQHGFWKYHDPEHRQYEPGNPYAEVIRDYYLNLDDEIGLLLELLDHETLVLVVSDHGAQRLDGGFCVNEWLIKERLLVLDEYPAKVTPFDQLAVNWDKTRVWSEGGYYARVFLNVKGREPRGTIDPADYEDFRNDVKARLEATVDDNGRNLGTLVYRPEDIYSRLNRVAPDLIVHFGGLGWRSIGGVGYPALHIQENDTGPDDCNHSQYGAFVLAGPDCSLRGELEGAHILDVAPTLLELAGYDVPASMQGQSWLKSQTRAVVADAGYTASEEELVRERLSGLGYIS